MGTQSQVFEAINNTVLGTGSQAADPYNTVDPYDTGSFDFNSYAADIDNMLQSNPEYQAMLAAEEKRRILEQKAEAKRLKLYGKSPIKYESDGVTPIDDSEAMLWAKQIANKILPDDWAFKAEIQGREVDMRNKDFIGASGKTLEDLRKEYIEAENNPMVLGGAYYLRKQVGIDESGNPQYVYKPGFAKHGAWDRYDQFGQPIFEDGWEVVGEKRFAGAEDWEKELQAILARNGLNAIDSGMVKVDGELVPRDEAVLGAEFGDGKTEIMGSDVLGLDKGLTPEQAAQNLEQSRVLGEYLNKHDRGSANPLRAFGSRATALAAGTGDWILDALTPGNNTLLDKYKSEEFTDDLFNYNSMHGQMELNEALDSLKRGNYGDAILATAKASPQVFAESLPMMLAMVTPVPGARAGVLVGAARLAKAAKGIRSEAQLLNKAKEIAGTFRSPGVTAEKIVADYDKYKDSIGKLNTIAHLAKNGGFYVNYLQYVNNQADELARNKAAAGQDPTIGYDDLARIAAIEYPMLMLDRFAFKDIISHKGATKFIKNALKSAPKDGKIGLAKKLLGAGAAFVKSAGEEGAQEFIQEFGDILTEQLGVKGNTLQSILTNPENLHRAQIASVGGVGAGGLTHAGSAIPAGIKNQWDKKTGKYSMSAAAKATSIDDLMSDEIMPSHAEAAIARNLQRMNTEDAPIPEVLTPQGFAKAVDTIAAKRIDALNEQVPEHGYGVEQIKKNVAKNIIDYALETAVNAAKQEGNTDRVKALTKNVAKIVSDPNVDLSVNDLEQMFSDRIANQFTDLVTNLSTKMKSTTGETGAAKMDIDDEIVGQEVDRMLNNIGLYQAVIDDIRGSSIDLGGGREVDVNDNIFNDTDTLTLNKLKDLLIKYRQGGKGISDVADEFKTYGYIEEKQKLGEGTSAKPFVKWYPSLKNYATRLKEQFSDPRKLKNLLNQKVLSGTHVNLGSLNRFAQSRYEKLVPYVDKKGNVKEKYVTPHLLSTIEKENYQLKELERQLSGLLTATKSDLTTEERAAIQEKLNSVRASIEESDALVLEMNDMLQKHIESVLGIKFKDNKPFLNRNIRQWTAGHGINVSLDKDGKLQLVPYTSFKKGDPEKNLRRQKDEFIKNGFAESVDDINFDAVQVRTQTQEQETAEAGKQESISDQEKQALPKQKAALEEAIEKAGENPSEMLIKKLAEVNRKLGEEPAPQTEQVDIEVPEQSRDIAKIEERLRILGQKIEEGAAEERNIIRESLKELRSLLSELKKDGSRGNSQIYALIGNLSSYIMKLENEIAKDEKSIHRLQGHRKIKGLRNLTEKIKDFWNRIRRRIKALIASKIGSEKIRNRLREIVDLNIEEQIAALDDLVSLAEDIQKDINTLSHYNRLSKKRKEALSEIGSLALSEYQKIIRKRSKKKSTSEQKTKRKRKKRSTGEEPAPQAAQETPTDIKKDIATESSSFSESDELVPDESMSNAELKKVTEENINSIIYSIDSLLEGC